MKLVKNITYLLSVVLLSAPMLTACYNDDPVVNSEIFITPPSERFSTVIQFVSKLDDSPIATDQTGYTAVNDYFTTTLDKRNKCWMGVIDRADVNYAASDMFNGAVTVTHNSRHYSCFTLNRINGNLFQGSMMLLNRYYTSTASHKVADDCHVNGVTAPMFGTRTDPPGEEGGSPTVTQVKFDVHFRTARFESEQHIGTFARDILPRLKQDRINMLMVGTVKSSLAASLEANIAENSDGAFRVTVVEQTKSKDYSIFVLRESRFWDLKETTSVSLGNGITAYQLDLMW